MLSDQYGPFNWDTLSGLSRALRTLQSSILIVNSNRYLQVEKETKKWFSVYDLLFEKVEES